MPSGCGGGRVHVNGMENFWSPGKRRLTCVYHSVEVEHPDCYLDEFTHRFNTRKMTGARRFAANGPRVSGKRLTYKALVGHV